MWILYIGLTIITQKDILYTDLLNTCGYLNFLPLSGVSQAQLGNRKRLRYRPSLSFYIYSNTVRRGWETCIMFFETFPNKEKNPGSVGAVPIPSSLSHMIFKVFDISY